MDTKRAFTTKKTTATPLVKSKGISTLKTKGDTPSETAWKTSTVTKNSSTGLKGSSGTPTKASSKSATKDIRVRSQVNLNEINRESLPEEAKLDRIDDAYNSYITLNALKMLSRKSKIKARCDIDKQISLLQNRVNDDMDALEKTRSKLNTLYLLEEQSNLLAQHKAACSSYAGEPAFTEGKSFEELMSEIDRIKNQLPCKHVCIPNTNTDIDDFQNATSQLLHSLELISSTYGADQVSVDRTATELNKMSNRSEALRNIQLCTDSAAQKASTTILNEAVRKIDELQMDKVMNTET